MNKSDASKLLAQQVIDEAFAEARAARDERNEFLSIWEDSVKESARSIGGLVLNRIQTDLDQSGPPQFEVVSDWEMKKNEAIVRISDGPDYQCTYSFRVAVELNNDHQELRRLLAVASQSMRQAEHRVTRITADKPAARAKILSDDLEKSESGKAVLAALVEHRKFLKAQV